MLDDRPVRLGAVSELPVVGDGITACGERDVERGGAERGCRLHGDCGRRVRRRDPDEKDQDRKDAPHSQKASSGDANGEAEGVERGVEDEAWIDARGFCPQVGEAKRKRCDHGKADHESVDEREGEGGEQDGRRLPERLEQRVAHAAEHELLDDRRDEDDDGGVRRELGRAARVEALRDQALLFVGIAELRDDRRDDEDDEDHDGRDAGGAPPGLRWTERQEPAPIEAPGQGEDDPEQDRVLEPGRDARLPAKRDVLRRPVAADPGAVGDERHESDDDGPAGQASVPVIH